MTMVTVILVAVLATVCYGNAFLQNPRGSNNRLHDKTAWNQNPNRLFDSQNIRRGGYNTGDRFDEGAEGEARRQYSMQYYGSGKDGSSKLMVEWTNRNGCGGNPKQTCNIVMQYMCMSNGTDADYPRENGQTSTDIYMRDGESGKTQEFSTNGDKTDKDMGLHESGWWYTSCVHREANGGLFTADIKLGKDKIGYTTASRTRQNNNGVRSGYECPEERDYFPYWVPTYQTENVDKDTHQRTPWIDVAWLGDKSRCNYIKKNSFNQNAKHRCVLSGDKTYGKSIDEASCTREGGNWVEFHSFIEVLTDVTTESACKQAAKSQGANKIVWEKLRSDDTSERCIVQAPEIHCDEAPWTRDNQLGNAENFGSNNDHPNASRIEIDLPYFPSGEAKRCVFRMRYNISTTDYDGWNTYADSNSAITSDPKVDVFGNGKDLKMALKTTQTGRTFQDRSHIYQILPRTTEMAGKTIYNLNVRGKRGNIVQTFPATEYDFIPNRMTVRKNDLVHIQWTGSNTHNNRNVGAAGEGRSGTDRSNLMELKLGDEGANYPKTIAESKFWEGVESLTDPSADGTDIAIGLASAGYYCSKKGTSSCPADRSLDGRKTKINNKMNNTPASYFGHVLKFTKTGGMNYLCTRNNNFSNRSQKGSLWVKN